MRPASSGEKRAMNVPSWRRPSPPSIHSSRFVDAAEAGGLFPFFHHTLLLYTLPQEEMKAYPIFVPSSKGRCYRSLKKQLRTIFRGHKRSAPGAHLLEQGGDKQDTTRCDLSGGIRFSLFKPPGDGLNQQRGHEVLHERI